MLIRPNERQALTANNYHPTSTCSTLARRKGDTMWNNKCSSCDKERVKEEQHSPSLLILDSYPLVQRSVVKWHSGGFSEGFFFFSRSSWGFRSKREEGALANQLREQSERKDNSWKRETTVAAQWCHKSNPHTSDFSLFCFFAFERVFILYTLSFKVFFHSIVW